jgi:outer membrane protein OmpA-like peptidoglycan-associated protein
MEGQLRIVFAADSSDIPDKAKAELDTLAQKLNADENLRVQLLAYASGAADQASQARRISLSRALAVRSYLIKQGVRSTRMDVRALGNNVKDSPQDRVDIISRAQ